MKPTDFSKGLTDFLGLYLPGERGLSHNTICAYKDTFLLFLTFMKERQSIEANKITLQLITQERIIKFLDWIQTERHCSNSTRNARLAALHCFFHYLQYRHPVRLYEWQRILSIPIKKTEKKTRNYLSLNAIKILLEQTNPSTLKGKRDLGLLSLMYDSGARVTEIINLMPSSMNFNKPYTIKLIGKGNKGRIVPLMESQVELLKDYMQSSMLLESNASDYALFSNSRMEKFTRMGITRILKKYTDKARDVNPSLYPQNVTPHIFRHSKAMHLLQSGVNLIYIRDFLGHASITTTEVYARADAKLKREALEKAHVGVAKNKNNESSSWMKDAELLEWLRALK
jgi:integrase/recombinase XerD